MKQYGYLVVGAGLTGATFARQKAEQGYDVLIIDKRGRIAGNAFDREPSWAPGMFIHQYGPHLFHTNSDKVFEFLSQFTEWRPYEHRVKAQIIPYGLLPLPVNFTTMSVLFGPKFNELRAELLKWFTWNQRVTLRQLREVADGKPLIQDLYDTVYETVFKGYTEKMWGLTLEQLGPTVADRVPIIIGDDDRYFADKYQYMPVQGYTKMVQNMLDHPNIEVRLNVRQVPELWNGDVVTGVYYTGPIDEFFGYKHGRLQYRGIHFEITFHREFRKLTDEVEWVGEAATHNYPMHGPETRQSSMAVIAGLDPNKKDVRVTEYPRRADDDYPPCYPIPTQLNRDLYAKYAEDAEKLDRVRFAGRMGTYQYLNMDQAVAQALKDAKEF